MIIPYLGCSSSRWGRTPGRWAWQTWPGRPQTKTSVPASSCQPPPTSLPHQKKIKVALEIYLLGTKEVPHIRGFKAVRKSGSSNPNWQVTHSSLFRTISYIIAHSVTQHSEISLWGTLTLRLGVTVVDAVPTLRRSYLGGGLKEWYIHERRSWIHKGCRDLDFGRKQSPMLYTQRQLLSATT